MLAETKSMQKKESQTREEAEHTRPKKVYTPAVDIIEEKDNMLLFADMPGVDENSVDITLDKDLLTIYGKVEPEIPEGLKLRVSEYGVGDYRRAFTISEEIDREKIQATVSNGVLKLTLPKAESARTRKILVKAEA